MIDSCNGLKVDNYYIQENGIVRDNESGVFLARLEELFEEIKEWRATKPKRGTKEYGYVKRCDLESIIDILLAEVDQHHTKFKEWDKATNLLIKKLAVATEALESLISANTQRITTARYIARTALERIEDGNQK